MGFHEICHPRYNLFWKMVLYEGIIVEQNPPGFQLEFYKLSLGNVIERKQYLNKCKIRSFFLHHIATYIKFAASKL